MLNREPAAQDRLKAKSPYGDATSIAVPTTVTRFWTLEPP